MADRPGRLSARATLRERWDVRFKGEGRGHGSAVEIHGPWRCRPRLGDAVRNVWAAEKDWGGRIRTSNLLVNSQALRQLSYTPKKTARSVVQAGGATSTRVKLHAYPPVLGQAIVIIISHDREPVHRISSIGTGRPLLGHNIPTWQAEEESDGSTRSLRHREQPLTCRLPS